MSPEELESSLVILAKEMHTMAMTVAEINAKREIDRRFLFLLFESLPEASKEHIRAGASAALRFTAIGSASGPAAVAEIDFIMGVLSK